MNNELIIRLTGAVTESNFEQFKTTALAQIKAANKTLVTDEDFASADETIKSCKTAEQAITKAKDEALNQTADIRTLFASLDELSTELATTRLALEKQVKKEKERRKEEVISAGNTQIEDEIKLIYTENPSLVGIMFKYDPNAVKNATAGKKTIEGMVKAIGFTVAVEIGAIREQSCTAMVNLERINFCEETHPGLFPDKRTVCLSQPSEVAALIDARVAKYKLRQIEIQQKKEADEQRKKEAEARAAEEKRKAQLSIVPPPDAPPVHIPAPKQPEAVPEPLAAKQEAPPVSQPDVPEKKAYIFQVELLCTRDQAIAFCEDLVEHIGESALMVGAPKLKAG